MLRLSIAIVGVVAASGIATAAPDPLDNVTVIYARGGALFKSSANGKNESQLVTLPANKPVRALRTDATGTTLLADIGGKWSWMALDGTATRLVELPCADGPAQLAADGACVLCRSLKDANKSTIVVLRTNKVIPVDVPSSGTRLVQTPQGRRLIWADAGGVWSAPPTDLRAKKKVAPEAPLRSFYPNHDGTRALGVYADAVFTGRHGTKPADVLMTYALDGTAARRKSVREGVPIEWSHDNQWILLQNGAAACLVKANGGQYKCFKGYTGVSISPDGKYALVLGNRDADTQRGSRRNDKKKKPAKQTEQEKATTPEGEPETAEGDDDDAVHDDVAVPPPTGPLALYRARLDGPFVDRPALVARVVDGAAVWVPSKP